jgi:peptidoglycan/xylan/chitin deacetylase (PgdA/CDA1 family)
MPTRTQLLPNYQISAGTLFEDFETFADWTKSSSASSAIASETGLVKTGTKSLKLTGSTDTHNCFADKTIDADFSDADVIAFWVYIPTLTNVSSVAIYIASQSNFSKYFSRTITAIHEGWNYLPVSRAEFGATGGEVWTNTMVRLRVRVNGTDDSVVAYFDSFYIGTKSKPKCIINFDDGRDSQYSKAYAYMQPKGLKGTCYIIGSEIGEADFMTVANLDTLYAAGWDLCNHGSVDLSTLETQALQEAEILSEEAYLVNYPRANKHYAYPMGGYDDNARAALANLGYLTARTIIDRRQANVLDERYLLTRYGVYNTTTVAAAKEFINVAIRQGSAILLNFHQIVDADADVDTKVLTADFNSIIDYIEMLVLQGAIEVQTISEWYNGLSQTRKQIV